MNERTKEQVTALAVDLLAHQYQLPTEKAEAIVATVMSVVTPPLERELANSKARTVSLEKASRDRSARVFQLMDRLCDTLESMLHYASNIHPRRGHCVDVPIDDRAAYEIEMILAEWRQLGGKLLYDRPVIRIEQRGQWDTSLSTTSSTLSDAFRRAKFD